jgi:hypothetical protein
MTPKKLIEVALPLSEINDASAYDKMPGIGPHPKGIHHWWARLPLPTARAVLFASVVDDPSSHPERFPTEEMQKAERERLFGILRRLMQKKMHEHPEVYAEAKAEMLKHCGESSRRCSIPLPAAARFPSRRPASGSRRMRPTSTPWRCCSTSATWNSSRAGRTSCQ